MKKGYFVFLIILAFITIAATGARLVFDEPQYIDKAFQSNDIKECHNIQTPSVKEFCINRVYYSQAINEKDAKYCEMITEDEAKQHCLEDLQKA